MASRAYLGAGLLLALAVGAAHLAWSPPPLENRLAAACVRSAGPDAPDDGERWRRATGRTTATVPERPWHGLGLHAAIACISRPDALVTVAAGVPGRRPLVALPPREIPLRI